MFLITAGEKRRIHREDGPYKPPTLCKECEKNPRPSSANNFPQRVTKRREKQGKKEANFFDLPEGTINSLSVMVSPSDYQHRVPRIPTKAEVKMWKARAQAEGKTLEQYKQGLIANGEWSPTETRQEHIERHVEGSSNQDPYRTPSVLAPVGASFEGAMAVISAACQSTDPNHVRQYKQPDGKIVRLSFTGNHDGLEKTILKETPAGLEVVTSFDGLTSAEAHKRVGNTWK